MYFKLKKSKITHWWVAEENQKMSFINILCNRDLKGNFLIVGYLDNSRKVLATSSNYVVRITNEGVITSRGTFYPFAEAHELYLRFLIKANIPNTVLANNWDFVNECSSNMIIADILKGKDTEKGIIFDFIPNESDFTLSGYSKTLDANVVISTFSKRNNSIILGIAQSVREDIFNSSFALQEETCKRTQEIKEIFDNNINAPYIALKVQLK